MGTGYDAVDVNALPPGGEFYLAYIDGAYQTLGALRARFPTATILTVTTSGAHPADICDVESEDATPAVAAAGVRSHLYDTIYSSTSKKGDLDAALAGLEWSWYAADPTGIPHLVPGSVATQYAWPGHGSPGNYDISETNGVWPGITPPPEGEDVTSLLVGSTLHVWWTNPSGQAFHWWQDQGPNAPDHSWHKEPMP